MFNRKILVAFAALGVLVGSNAFASRAHEVVMGTGDGHSVLNGGSFFYDDNRNIFYNPAYVNDFKNWASIEKSNHPGTTAEGGFVASFSNINVGAYFNRGDAVVAFPGLATGALTAGTLAGTAGGGKGNPGSATYFSGSDPLRPIELFIGGDMGVKWGLGLTYASSSVASTAGDTSTKGNKGYFAANIGAAVQGFEPFFGIQLIGNDLDKDKKHSHVRGGFRYHWGEWTPFAAILATSYKDETVANTVSKVNGTNWGFGLGRSAKISEGARLNYALSYWSVNEKTTVGATGSEVETSYNRGIVPIDMSVEGDLASWLTLRAGLGFRVFDSIGGPAAQDVSDTTTARVGAGLHFGKADIDWAFGAGNNGLGAETTDAGPGASQVDSQTLGLGFSVFTALGVTYHW
jgi:hypothetical protein